MYTHPLSRTLQSVRCVMYGLPPEGGKWTEAATNLLWEKEENLNVSVSVFCVYSLALSLSPQVVSKGSEDTLPVVTLTQCTEGEEVDLNQWLASQTQLFLEPTHQFFEM